MSADQDHKFRPIFLKLPPENIVLLKFTLESYDGLCIVRTLNPQTGELVILALSDTIDEVHKILQSIESDFGVRIVPPPADLDQDWLLREEKDCIAS